MPIREPPYRREWREQDQSGYARFQQMRAPAPKPLGSYWLLGTIIGVYVLQQFVLAFGGLALHHRLFVIDIDWYLRPWTLITSTLAHDPGGLSHIFFNGIFLYFLGPTVETIVGRRRFLLLFFATGAVAGVFQAHLSSYMTGDLDPTRGGALGASGGLMALFGFLVLLTPKSKMFVWPLPVPIPMWVAGLAFVLLDLVGAFNPYDRVGNFAHLAGLALGACYGWYVKLQLQQRGLRVHYGA